MATIYLLTALMLMSVPENCKVAGFITACYFTSWSAQTSNTQVRLTVEDTDPDLCTHLIYAFAKLDVQAKTIAAIDPAKEYSLYEKFNNLKSKNSNLKTLLSVGGEGSANGFSQLSASSSSYQQFARNTITFLRKHGFDGLDVDWEYPTNVTKQMFTDFLKILRQEFTNEAMNGEPLLLTTAVAAGEDRIKAGYDIKAVSSNVDFIFVMTYDFSGSWSTVTGFNSPLYARNDTRFSKIYNVQYALNVWINGGADRSKVIMGMTGAGARFTLSNISDHNVGSPVMVGGGHPGPLYKLKGRLIYPEICLSFKTGWTRVWDEEQLVPYAYSGDQWVGYDDSQSFDFKVQYVIDEHLGGVMFWELSYDDAKNYCKKGPFPLLNLVKQTFANHHKETNHTSTMETSSSNIVSQTTGATDQTTTAFASPSHSGRATTAPINDGITFTGTTSILVLTVCGIRVYT